MIKRLGLAVSLAISTLGAGSVVHADCVVIDQLDKLQIIQARLARDPDTALFAADIRQIRKMSAGLTNSAALDAVDGNGFVGPGADVLRFLQNTQALLQRVSLDDPHSVRPHFDAKIRENLAQVAAHLTSIRCNETQIAVELANAVGRGSGGSSDAEDLAKVAETLDRLADNVFQLRTLLIIALVGAGLSVGLPLLRRYVVLRRRREKRHNTTYATRYIWDDRKIDGMLIDINCHGTKLRHEADNPLPEGVSLEIEVCSTWIEGTVRWSNAHYSGVQFRKSIALSDVEVVCSTEQRPKTQNGAPKDAA